MYTRNQGRAKNIFKSNIQTRKFQVGIMFFFQKQDLTGSFRLRRQDDELFALDDESIALDE